MADKIFINMENRKDKPFALFGLWVPTQIGILGLIYGAIIVSYGLNFIQSVLAAFLGAMSFLLVGYLSLSGKYGDTTTFNLSRVVFGLKGNYIPTLCAWINLVGWMCVNVVTATLTLLSLLGILGISNNTFTIISSLILLAILVAAAALINQNALIKLQTIFTYIFGAMTLVILGFLLLKTDISSLMAAEPGDWLGGFLPAVSIIIAGTGISWAICAADYSVYQNPNNSDRSIIFMTTLAGFIPLFILMFMGILLSSSVADLLSSSNPIDIIGLQLPNFMTIPYLLTALVGLIAPCVISLRSARVELNSLNIYVSDIKAISIHLIIMLSIGIYILFSDTNFLDVFQSFLGLIGIALAGWSAVFLMDYILLRRHNGYDKDLILNINNKNTYNFNGIFSWILGVFIGFLFTNCAFFDGPFAQGIFRDNSLGMMITFMLSMVSYAIGLIIRK